MHKSLCFCLLALLLSACYVAKPADEPPPVVEVHGTSTVLRTIQVNMRSTVKNAKLGMSATTPSGLKASYLYSTTTARTQRKPDKIRVDLPSSMFKDGRTRSAVYLPRTLGVAAAGADVEGSGSEFLVFFSDNQADTLSNEALAGAADSLDLFALISPLSDNPFAKMLPDVFVAAAKEKGFNITATSDSTTTASQTVQMNGATLQQTLTYDAATGAVTHIESVTQSAQVLERTSADIKYVNVPQIPGMVVPYEITGGTTTTGMYMRPFGGSISSSHTVRFGDIKVNSLSDSYFPGGR